ncbi:gastrula zinc finger protein xFG20-1-like isoform X2 [Glossina fuscipes]|uniref:Gastrula zinc finger protein xFG20-1-like isoform X2 n=1 Tax=Glossina fuscipes TaxID=7396 RepID=A0A9C6DZ19_9MUSC|nr:gastrula zinc finger protein xFG20-1-like isoform X2 [Glossina fuscipes]
MALKMCRICGDNKDLKSILMEGEELQEKLLICTNIKININDSLPKHICVKCEQNLEFSYRLRKQSEATEERLRKELEANVDQATQIIPQEKKELDLLDEFVLDEKVEEFIKITEEEKTIAACISEQFQLQETHVRDIRDEIEEYDTKTDIVDDVVSDNCREILEGARREDVIDLISESSSIANDWIPPTDSETDIVPSIDDKESMFICLICGLTCHFRSNYNNHLKTHLSCDKINGIKKRHKCPHCDSSYSHRASLNRHTRTLHHDLKTYTCPIYISRDGKRLCTDARIKEKPYACTNCNKTFSTTGALLNHQRNHTSLRQYQCDLCLQGFVELSDMKKHKLAHDSNGPLFCQICRMGFIEKGNLRRHMRKHVNKMPFACALCSQQFYTLLSLTKHSTKVHGRSVPYNNKEYNNINDLSNTEEYNISNTDIHNGSKESSETDDASETIDNSQIEENAILIQNGFESNIISSRIYSLDCISSENKRILDAEHNRQNKESIQNGFNNSEFICGEMYSLDGSGSENAKIVSETLDSEHITQTEESVENAFVNDVQISGRIYSLDSVGSDNIEHVSETLDAERTEHNEQSIRNDSDNNILISSKIYSLDSPSSENTLSASEISDNQHIEQRESSIPDGYDNILISSVYSFNSATNHNVQDFLVIESSNSNASVIDITNDIEDEPASQTRTEQVSTGDMHFHGLLTRST